MTEKNTLMLVQDDYTRLLVNMQKAIKLVDFPEGAIVRIERLDKPARTWREETIAKICNYIDDLSSTTNARSRKYYYRHRSIELKKLLKSGEREDNL